MHALGIDAAKDLERHCCAHEFTEAVRERLHLVPLAFARTARRLSDEEKQERRNRQRHEEEQSGEGIRKYCHNEDQRDQHRTRDHRRYYRVEEWVECIYALKDQRQCTCRGASVHQHRLVQGRAYRDAQPMGELRIDASLGEAQQCHREDAQKQHQKI